jgi:hypothetical protein
MSVERTGTLQQSSYRTIYTNGYTKQTIETGISLILVVASLIIFATVNNNLPFSFGKYMCKIHALCCTVCRSVSLAYTD